MNAVGEREKKRYSGAHSRVATLIQPSFQKEKKALHAVVPKRFIRVCCVIFFLTRFVALYSAVCRDVCTFHLHSFLRWLLRRDTDSSYYFLLFFFRHGLLPAE